MTEEIYLFKGVAPGSEHVEIIEESFEEIDSDNSLKKITQTVIKPALIPYIPENPNGIAMLIIPGGGFRRLVMSKEGSAIAHWLNSLGITAFVLKHRMPGDGHEKGAFVPLQDAQRALRVMRSLSSQYGFEKNKIGVIGFSAGGHVASTLGTSFDRSVYDPVDEVDSISARPDFMALIYPVISLHSYGSCGSELPLHTRKNGDIMKEFPTDQLINSNTPQTFLVVADDDPTTPSENSLNFYLGLRKAGVEGELHVFRKGGHGFGLGKIRGNVAPWPGLFEKWISTVEFN